MKHNPNDFDFERPGRPLPELGFEFICCSCGAVCSAKWQDIGVYDRREMAWRSDCCGSLIDENPKEN